MRTLRGPAIAFVAFAAAFALHIVAGALDQGWLFAIAVVLIFGVAAGFPVLSMFLGRPRSASQLQAILVIGGAGCLALTAGTLWAANDRAWAWWTWPAAAAIALVTTVAAGRLNRAA